MGPDYASCSRCVVKLLARCEKWARGATPPDEVASISSYGIIAQPPRTTDLCTDMDFRTWTAISGNWSTWSRAQSSNLKRIWQVPAGRLEPVSLSPARLCKPANVKQGIGLLRELF